MINFHRGSRTRKMLRICAIFFLCFAAAQADGDLFVLHAPPSITFQGSAILKIAQLGDVLNAVTGKEISDTADWSALIIKDPFHLAQNVIILHIKGVTGFNTDNALFSFRVSGNKVASSLKPLKEANKKICAVDFGNENSSLTELEQCVGEFTPPQIEVNTTLQTTDEAQHNILKSLAAFNIFARRVEDALNKNQFSFLTLDLTSIATAASSSYTNINDAIGLIEAAGKTEDETEDIDGKTDLNNTDTVGYERGVLVAKENYNNDAETEAFRLINYAIATIKYGLNTTDKRVLFAVLTSEADKSTDSSGEGKKQSRSKREVIPESDKNKYNLATYYDQNYPVIFNIILWFMVAFGLSLLAICYAIADMDPGRDSIIYRMTSTRMKKDN